MRYNRIQEKNCDNFHSMRLYVSHIAKKFEAEKDPFDKSRLREALIIEEAQFCVAVCHNYSKCRCFV